MKTVVLILIMFTALTAFADEPKVLFYGKVVNDSTGLPIAGVGISVAYGYGYGMTDTEGDFSVEVEKKYCVDSLFYFGKYDVLPTWEAKLVPGIFNEVRYKKPKVEPSPTLNVTKTYNCFGAENPADWYKMQKEQEKDTTGFIEHPQKVEFFGQVVDDVTGMPLPGVEVKLDFGLLRPVKTDNNGNFCIEVDKKLCIDSMFTIRPDWGWAYSQTLVPWKHQVVRYKNIPPQIITITISIDIIKPNIIRNNNHADI